MDSFLFWLVWMIILFIFWQLGEWVSRKSRERSHKE